MHYGLIEQYGYSTIKILITSFCHDFQVQVKFYAFVSIFGNEHHSHHSCVIALSKLSKSVGFIVLW